MKEIETERNRYLCSDYILDVVLFLKILFDNWEEELKDYIICMNKCQYKLYLECKEKREDFNKLLLHSSNGFYLYQWRASKYLKAIELLNHSKIKLQIK